VKTSCSCESAGVAIGDVVPASGVLPVTYALSRYGAGERNGHLTITTDSEVASLRRIELNLRVYVQAKVWATPSEVELESADEQPPQLLRIESIVPGLLGKFKDVSTNRGNVAVVPREMRDDLLIFNVTLAQSAPWGTSYDLIYVTFNDREHPSLTIRVKAKKGHALAIIPATLRVAPSAGEAQERKVRIMSPASASGAFRVTRVECPKEVTVGATPIEKANSVDVSLRLRRSESAEVEQKVIFYTDPPGAATLIIHYLSQP